MSSSALRLATVAAATLAVAFAANAATKAIKPLQTWTGSMPAEVQPLFQASIANAADLNRVWATCQVKGAVPKIDFGKRVVLLAVRRGGVRFASLNLDNGNVKTNVVLSPEATKQHTCALALVDRAGINTVNGAPLGM